MKINNELVWGLGGLFLGYLLFKRAAVTQQASPTQSNEITSTGQWWTYAGLWQ